MNAIKTFIERLKTLESSQMKRYPYEQYECEIAFTQLCHKNGDFANEKLKQMWKDVFHQPFFELHHPTLNSIKTRAVATYKGYGNSFIYTFFVDENEKYPWIMYSVHNIASSIITKEEFFINEIHLSNKDYIWIRWTVTSEIKQMLQENVFNENTFIFKDSPFCLDLSHKRPTHYFADSLYYYYYLNLEKFRIRKSPLFFIPKIMNDHFIEDLEDGIINISPRIGCYNGKFNFSPQKESLEDFNSLVENQDKMDKFDKIDINQKEISSFMTTGGIKCVFSPSVVRNSGRT